MRLIVRSASAVRHVKAILLGLPSRLNQSSHFMIKRRVKGRVRLLWGLGGRPTRLSLLREMLSHPGFGEWTKTLLLGALQVREKERSELIVFSGAKTGVFAADT
jgi:hypothetical protein